ncbi:hypothetical protein MIMGU_mgv11b022432mg [Erythranthe guttata]|uniref:Uncharacterized protein n=1 Tax=Erythranthe guttata TaxID=4155 RepID=A0A022REY1_ERYGU|nr:hypothetical protein MIMGU_mgv11b022432mg [Erythranthe guttata]
MADGAEKVTEESSYNTAPLSLKTSKADVITAAGDDNLKEIFHQIRTSKNPVSQIPLHFFFFPTLYCIEIVFMSN